MNTVSSESRLSNVWTFLVRKLGLCYIFLVNNKNMAESEKMNYRACSDEVLKSCLPEFVRSNNVEAIKFAVKKGISVNTGDNSGITPLHVASMSDTNLQCLKELLKSKSADVNARTCYGDTPSIFSCQTTSDNILKTLIDHGADVNLMNFKNLTPIHIACWTGRWNPVKLLIKAGANVNTKDIYGFTPLHKAISVGNDKVCKHLLQHGANANIPTDDGQLPLHMILSKRNGKMYNLIRVNTKNDTIMKYCTFPGPNGVDTVHRGILCLALASRKKNLIEMVLKSELPNAVLNCPIVVKQPFLLNDYLNENGELQSFDGKLVLFTPLCYFLHLNCENISAALDVLQMLIDNNICVSSTFNSSDSLYVVGCIELMLHTWCLQVDRFKILTMLLENGIDPDEECNGMPTKLLKLCIIKNVDKSVFMLLLKASNVVEPEDILRWIIDNRKREFMQRRGIQDLVYALLPLSPYVSMSLSVCNHFLTPPYYYEEENVLEKIRQICEYPVRPLASYCRSIIRRQLHYETRNSRRQFKEKLNSLPVPKTLISYLTFDEIKFITNEITKNVNYQIICDW